MPFSPGSLSASSARSSVFVRAAHSPRFVFCAAVLEIDELVADAAVGLDVDARAEVRAGAAGDAAGRDLERVGGDERDLLARVALGRRVGDVVAGRVQQALLGQQAAQRGLESVEGGDRHGYALRSRTRCRAGADGWAEPVVGSA